MKDKYLSVNTSYYPQQENNPPRVLRKKSSSGVLNISFPSIQGDLPPHESNYNLHPPSESPPQKQPTRIYSEDYSTMPRHSLPVVRKQSFDHFTKRHYSQLSPVNIYTGGVRDLQDFSGRPLDNIDSKLQEKSLRELLKLQKRASHIEIKEEKEDSQESLSIQEDQEENFVPMSYKKHLKELKSSRIRQQQQNERPESRQGYQKECKARGNKFRITGAGFHQKGASKKNLQLDRDSKALFILQANLPRSLRKYERKEQSPLKKKRVIESPKANEDLYSYMMKTVDECDEDPRSALQTED